MKTTPTDTIPALVGRLRATFLTGKTRCVEYRKNQLKQLYFLVKDNEEAFVDAIGQDLGRPGMETTFAEVIGIENDLATSISQLSKWSKDECVGAGLPFMLHGTKIRKDPKGTVLVLGAWNYPITVQLGPMVGAIAAGNTVILKPSELSPHTAQLIADLWSKYMDTETTAVVNGGIPEATALLDQRFEHIFYTGSGRVGRIVAEKAARWLCPVSLELGGKSPVIVDASADLKIAAHRTLWAKAFNGVRRVWRQTIALWIDGCKTSLRMSSCKRSASFGHRGTTRSVILAASCQTTIGSEFTALFLRRKLSLWWVAQLARTRRQGSSHSRS